VDTAKIRLKGPIAGSHRPPAQVAAIQRRLSTRVGCRSRLFFEAGVVLEPGLDADGCLKRFVVALGPVRGDQQAEAFLEGSGCRIGRFRLLVQRLRHACKRRVWRFVPGVG